MNKKTVSAIVFIVAALIVVIILALIFKKSPTISDSTTSAPHETTNPAGQTASTTGVTATTSTTSTTGTTGTKTYTLADVAKHSTASDCWTTVNGGVYNLTPFVGQHPGGPVILSICGKDGSAAFTAQHGGQQRPENELASLKIGVLAK